MSDTIDLHGNVLAATDVLFPKKRSQALKQLYDAGLINQETLPAWEKELSKKKYHTRLINYLIAALKIRVDDELERYGGELTRQKSLEIIKNVIHALSAADKKAFFDQTRIRGLTAMDFGAGVYSPLSAAILFFANGYRNVIAVEPFPIHIQFAAASVAQTMQWVMFEPGAVNFSGIDNRELKRRMWLLDVERITERLDRFNRDEIDSIDFGGVILAKKLTGIAPWSVDLIFSNSVLEHIKDLPAELSAHKNMLTRGGACVHTVDFGDHRAHGTDLNVFQMYYDGVLDDINGLRPSQVEKMIVEAGFKGTRIHKLSVPDGYIDSTRHMLKPYADFSPEELSVWVNSYVLSLT